METKLFCKFIIKKKLAAFIIIEKMLVGVRLSK